MPLESQLFTTPTSDSRLEACLVRDSAHIVPGTQGDHVKKIQTALNLLTQGPGRENVRLKATGFYGPQTAAAVERFKNARGILQTWQKQADNIVGKRTIQRLDAEMAILENELPLSGGLIAPTAFGSPHDHSKCPTAPRVTGPTLNGGASHHATPINPKNTGIKINIYGEGETDYLGFVDFATEPQFANGRPLTARLAGGSVSDIAMRSAPLSATTMQEIRRVARPLTAGGCRFTYASNQVTFAPPKAALLTMGIVIQQGRVVSSGHEDDPNWDMEVWVIELR